MFIPRSFQKEIINYTSGKMGVSAVPGSGKTQTLSVLAANLIRSNHLKEDQEILIVTLANSAVDNFYARISKILEPKSAFSDFGYRVRTLHGLAHEIIRERPSLVGLSSQFQIIQEQEQELLIKDAAYGWLRANPEFIDDYSERNLNQNEIISRRNQKWLDVISSIAFAFIRQAKDFQVTPDEILQKYSSRGVNNLLLKAGIEIYWDYQRALNYRSAVDFDDLIMLALQALQNDKDFLERLQYRWPFILEDEAQDSSRLQEVILTLLTSQTGSWIRVGDPNQAIYETFTTANPRFLINFRLRDDVKSVNLPQSGRSTIAIINFANFIIEWVQNNHPIPELRTALVDPKIKPTDPDDPQPNPPEIERGIYIHQKKLSPEEEIEWVAKSISQWLLQNPERTIAALVPRNDRGAELAIALRHYHIEPVELLRSSPSTRQAVQIINSVLKHLLDPLAPHTLIALFESLSSLQEQSEESKESIRLVKKFFSKINHLENLLYPSSERDWLNSREFSILPEGVQNEILAFRERVIRWHSAVLLPIEQLIMTISQDLFDQPVDIALSHALAQSIEQEIKLHPEWTLADITIELDRIVTNKRKFVGFSEDDLGFDPETHKGQVVITTIHKAKGLEWDRVYILSVNNYDFPSVEPHDTYISEKYFVRGKLNLEAEALAQLKTLIQDENSPYPQEGEATSHARMDYASERLRLLYVGITRAKRELRITWNSGKRGNCVPALPLMKLMEYLEYENDRNLV